MFLAFLPSVVLLFSGGCGIMIPESRIFDTSEGWIPMVASISLTFLMLEVLRFSELSVILFL